MNTTEKKNLRHLTHDELLSWFEQGGEKKFRANQCWDWLWKKGAQSIDEMSNVSKPMREKLKEEFVFTALKTDAVQKSEDGTIKMRFKTFDGFAIEGVLIVTSTRMTACVSSQIGCSLSCKFCATGQMDRKRNLNFDEIFDQVVLLNRIAEKEYQRPLSNIVFMGMGEPLLNYSNVIKAIDKITSPDSLAMSPRRITVSTAGIAKMIHKLADDKVRFRLALSLHATNDAKRNKIMAINETNNLENLIEELNYFFDQTGNRISLEYILLKDFNDSLDDAKELVKIVRRIPCRVNLIEYNAVKGLPFEKSDTKKAKMFEDYLLKQNVMASIRYSRGKDIDAACGQLANK